MAIITARFAYARKPVIVEEMGHFAKDREQATRETISLLKALRGHVSGYLLWCLSDQKDNPIGPLDVDLKPNSFGEQWAKLAEPGGVVDAVGAAGRGGALLRRAERRQRCVPCRASV